MTHSTSSGQAYYGDGRRRKYEDAAGARIFLWDGENISRQHDTAGNINRRYTYRPQGYGELISQDDNFHHGVYPERSRGDAMGNTDRITDANQAIVVTYTYQAFGQQSQTGASANRFTRSTSSGQAWGGRMGYYRQPDSEDYWLRARLHNPFNGRFMNTDPAAAEVNLYRWPGNNPIMIADPSGLQGCPHGPGCQHHGGCVTGSMVSDGRLIRPNRPGGRGWDREGAGRIISPIGQTGPGGGTGQWPCPTIGPDPMHQMYQSVCMCRVSGGYCGICAKKPLTFLGCSTVSAGGVDNIGDCKGKFITPTGVVLTVPGRIITSCPGGQAVHVCGPDITLALKNTMDWVTSELSHMLNYEPWIAARNCIQLISPTGWEIWALVGTLFPPQNTLFDDYSNSCATSTCTGTVQVDGGCHYAHQVNYMLFGRLGHFCSYYEFELSNLIRLWKSLSGRSWEADDAIAWMHAGYNRWPNSATPASQVPQCGRCSVQFPSRRFCWDFGQSRFGEDCQG